MMLHTGVLQIHVQISEKDPASKTAGAANVVTTRKRIPGPSLKTYKKASLVSSSIAQAPCFVFKLEFLTFHSTLSNEGTLLAGHVMTMVN